MKCELYNDSMQNWKKYPIQKAQLIIADVPYNVGNNFYGSNPMFDGESNDYYNSEIKKFIEDWFKRKVKKYYGKE